MARPIHTVNSRSSVRLSVIGLPASETILYDRSASLPTYIPLRASNFKCSERFFSENLSQHSSCRFGSLSGFGLGAVFSENLRQHLIRRQLPVKPLPHDHHPVIVRSAHWKHVQRVRARVEQIPAEQHDLIDSVARQIAQKNTLLNSL